MKGNLIYAVQKLKTAFKTLKLSVEETIDALDRDGVIQRFEFTFELFWKTIKILLEHEGFNCLGPRSCIKEGARKGLLTEPEIILDMLEDRNKTTHIYDETTASEIFNRIKMQYIDVIETNIKLFENYMETDN